jgi:TPR repeat protein
MKRILLMIALVGLMGCGKKEPVQPSASDLATPPPFAETKAKAEAGDADAQFNLGVMYYQGLGVEQDLKEAVKWFQKTANQGNANAQHNLGVMYANGKGVEQNYVTAYAWESIAATNGDNIDPRFKSHVLEVKMTPAQIAEAEELVKEMVKKNPKLLNTK